MILVSLSSDRRRDPRHDEDAHRGIDGGLFRERDVEAKRAQQWSTLKHQEYQRGGSANNAAEAMTTGDFRRFFAKAAPSTMVPISFTVKMLNGTRKVARIGDLTKYNAPDCLTSGSWSPVTTLADGAFKSIGVGLADDVWCGQRRECGQAVHVRPDEDDPLEAFSRGRAVRPETRLSDQPGIGGA